MNENLGCFLRLAGFIGLVLLGFLILIWLGPVSWQGMPRVSRSFADAFVDELLPLIATGSCSSIGVRFLCRRMQAQRRQHHVIRLLGFGGFIGAAVSGGWLYLQSVFYPLLIADAFPASAARTFYNTLTGVVLGGIVGLGIGWLQTRKCNAFFTNNSRQENY